MKDIKKEIMNKVDGVKQETKKVHEEVREKRAKKYKRAVYVRIENRFRDIIKNIFGNGYKVKPFSKKERGIIRNLLDRISLEELLDYLDLYEKVLIKIRDMDLEGYVINPTIGFIIKYLDDLRNLYNHEIEDWEFMYKVFKIKPRRGGNGRVKAEDKSNIKRGDYRGWNGKDVGW